MRVIIYSKNIFLNLAKTWSIVALIFVPILGLLIVYPNLIRQLSHIISQHELFFTVFRWAILCMIYSLWPIFVRKMGKYKYWSQGQIDYWIKQRRKVTLWLILFELIVNEELLSLIWSSWK